jgi:putative ABC transport system permease protein
VDELAAVRGVLAVEPRRSVAVRLTAGPRTERAELTGLADGARLHRVVDADHRPVAVPEHGIVLTGKLAEILDVDIGDEITVEILEGRRPTVRLALVAKGGERIGKPAYMSLSALNRVLGDGPLLSGASLLVDPVLEDAVFRELKELPTVAGVMVQSAAVKSFRETMAETIDIILGFYLAFGGMIAAGTVYNSARISLSERGREIASLRVLGFTRLEVSFILLAEIAILTALALPLGCVAGYGMAALMASAFQTELFRLPLVVNADTYGLAVATVALAALAAGLLVRRRIDDFDLVQVLKTRE